MIRKYTILPYVGSLLTIDPQVSCMELSLVKLVVLILDASAQAIVAIHRLLYLFVNNASVLRALISCRFAFVLNVLEDESEVDVLIFSHIFSVECEVAMHL